MNLRFKRAGRAVVAIAVASVTVPLLFAPPASAAGTLAGQATITPPSGGSAAPFTVALPAGAQCAEDSAGGDWRVTSYMVPLAVNPSTLTFDPSGPTSPDVGANFRQPLWNTGGSPHVSKSTQNADTPGGPGAVLAPGAMDFTVFGPGDIPAGVYNVGIACTDETQAMQQYWNTTMTITTAPGDSPAQVTWRYGQAAVAPVLAVPVEPGNAQLTATFTQTPASIPASSYTATATPTPVGTDPECTNPAPVTSPSQLTTAPIVVGSLINDCTYSVVVTANNGFPVPAVSNSVSGTPTAPPRPPVASIDATAGTGSANVVWTAPASGPTPTGYTLVVTNGGGQPNGSPASPINLGPTVFSQNVTSLTPGTTYTFTVTPTHGTAPAALSAFDTAIPTSDQVLQQHLQVTRPEGALVLTQVCSANGPLLAEGAQLGFPAGTLPAVDPVAPVSAAVNAPFTNWPGTIQDGNYSEYPYPVDTATQVPNEVYPTHCGVNLGVAEFVTKGPGSGQFFRASGVLSQVSVVDTRDDDIGWTINGRMGTFSNGLAGSGNSFSGSQLGWTPYVTDDSDFVTFSDSTTYDQTVEVGTHLVPTGVAPNTLNASGLGSTRALAHADQGAGLGIAVLDARLKLLIPVTANSGDYTGVLYITTI